MVDDDYRKAKAMNTIKDNLQTNILEEDELFPGVYHAMEKFNFKEDGLIEVLIAAQESHGFLSKDLLAYISKNMHIPMSRIYGVATFYDMFTFESKGATDCIVCTGPSCSIAGGEDVLAEIYHQTGVSESGQASLDGRYRVSQVSCLGLCDQAPATLINKKTQVNISVEEVPKVLTGEAGLSRIQVCGNPRELTSPIGILPPTDLDAHRSEGAFSALEKALYEMTPEQVIDEVKESRLTGRGGAGFSTGMKWEFTRKATGKSKYIVCNFDESEPGTFKDRVLMEGNPFRVIEGMTISAYASGADDGYIFIRGEYPAATEILEEAVDEAYAEGLLGEDILGSGVDFNVDIRHNAGAYICGEETALFEAIEGKRGLPRHKPPYPTQAGLFGRPTAINNVETLAVIPSLIVHGGEWFRQWGTDVSTGLKLFCLSGHINSPGVVEAPYGLPVIELIEQFGGGFVGEPQAVLIGGAAGGFLHPDNLDTPLTHEDLRKFNVPIGSGAIMVFNQSVDLWHVIEGLARFFVDECCGQCAPCRLGTKQIYNILQRINLGNFETADLFNAKKLGQTIKTTCVCGLGMTAANPLLTYLHNFEPAILA
jgi:NADH-quinone oxidoreductase subunit F